MKTFKWLWTLSAKGIWRRVNWLCERSPNSFRNTFTGGDIWRICYSPKGGIGKPLTATANARRSFLDCSKPIHWKRNATAISVDLLRLLSVGVDPALLPPILLRQFLRRRTACLEQVLDARLLRPFSP